MSNNYGIFFTGLASTPWTIGIINWSTNEKFCEFKIKGDTGKEIRADYERRKKQIESLFTPFKALNNNQNN